MVKLLLEHGTHDNDGCYQDQALLEGLSKEGMSALGKVFLTTAQILMLQDDHWTLLHHAGPSGDVDGLKPLGYSFSRARQYEFQ